MRLVEPLALGRREAPSRVMFGPHATNLGQGRAISPRHVAYYARRASGGVGLIVTETASVHDSDWPYERAPSSSECGAGWRDVSTAAHAHGALVVAGLGHAGSQGSSAFSQRALLAPSRVPAVNTREVPKSMERSEIDEVVEGFAVAAAKAVESGCDGVEVNAGQYSLLREFLSGLTNQRGDEFGVDRAVLVEQVLTAVRGAVGPSSIVGLRLSCDELAPWAGITPEAGAELAARLAGHVDYLVVVRGSIFSVAETRPDGHTEPGFNLDLAGDVRRAVRAVHGERVAVLAQGSILDVAQAEWALGDGDRCDGVEMTRALLADAALVTRARAGQVERIRPCIACNQTCRVRDDRNPVITCVVDPSTGHELDEPAPDDSPPGPPGPAEPAGSTRGSADATTVVVVGGGPGGLEAARVAATLGHRVRLVERHDRLGGAVLVAARGSGRGRLAAFIEWQERECRRLGVELVTGVEVRPDTGSQALRWGDRPADAVIVATGGVDAPREEPVTRAAVVVSAYDYLDGAELPDGAVAVWDPVGGPVAVSVAERLAAEGREVHFACPDVIVGTQLSRTQDLTPANVRLHRAGVTLHKRRRLRAVKKGVVELADLSSEAVDVVRVSAVVHCGHRVPDPALFEALSASAEAPRGPAPTVLRVGDAVAPRTIAEAVLEARRAVAALMAPSWVSDGVPMGRRH